MQGDIHVYAARCMLIIIDYRVMIIGEIISAEQKFSFTFDHFFCLCLTIASNHDEFDLACFDQDIKIDLRKDCISFDQGNTLYTHLHLRRDKFYMNKVTEAQ